MSVQLKNYRVYARILLAGIRLFYGSAALFVPTLLIRQLGGNPNSNPIAIYAFRLFGVRTILIGVELLLPDEKLRENALRLAIPIHATDTISAALTGIQGLLPPRTSIMITLVSGVNTTLAILAQPPED